MKTPRTWSTELLIIALLAGMAVGFLVSDYFENKHAAKVQQCQA